jgi:hypothetical protein
MQHGRAVGQHHVDLGAQHLEDLRGLAHVVVVQAVASASGRSPCRPCSGRRPGRREDGTGIVLGHHGVDARGSSAGVRRGVKVGAVAGLDAARAEEQALAAGQPHLACRAGAAARPPGGRCDPPPASPPRRRWARAASRLRRTGGRRWPGRPARQAFGGLQVHQQARAGVDLDDRAALRLQRLGRCLPPPGRCRRCPGPRCARPAEAR